MSKLLGGETQILGTSVLPDVRGIRVLVIGEVILDRYIWGEVTRVSPEAPIPVLRVQRREERPGNAAFVAASLRALGSDVAALSVVGDDHNGRVLLEMLKREGIDTRWIWSDPSRPTIVKERMMGYVQSAMRGTQQLLRVDEERPEALNPELAEALLRHVKAEACNANGILISDINKGLLSSALITAIVQEGKEHDIPVIIDPRMGPGYSSYSGATVLTPNRHEAEVVIGASLGSRDSWKWAADKINRDLDLKACLITLDRDGVYLGVNGGAHVHLPTTPRDVNDVTGAGDVVLSVFGLHVIAGCGFSESALLANIAAGLEVGKVGAQIIERSELARAIKYAPRSWAKKIVTSSELVRRLDDDRGLGRKIVFTIRRFDLLHAEDIEFLSFARDQGDLLVVGLSSVENRTAVNGQYPTAYSETERAQILAALECVNYVIATDESVMESTIERLRPDVLVKDWALRGKLAADDRFVESYGGRIVVAPVPQDSSNPRMLPGIGSLQHA
jgi:D-beta-D-heptose 7-phosphate kinase / D-beta-D-heptose 1-phosphate adenosyltransferase